jgi:alpha-amylase
MRSVLLAFLAAAVSPYAFAATADQWRGRSIYQYIFTPPPLRPTISSISPLFSRIIVDRYALPKDSPNVPCDTNKRTWCGGTWNS